ncbi:MAG: beta strand repeat-containing protein [Leptospirillia bacterium]
MGKPGLFRTLMSGLLAVAIPFATMPEVALALPHGGKVTRGGATLSYSTNKLLITQSTSRASFSWSGFNVGSNQSVTYKTPGASSVSMNFIGGTSPATISGKVVSNGILYFMDANGLIFGSGSTVSASGVRAYGSATPGGTLTGSVTNAGAISVATGGTVAMVGSSVTNSGTITAPSGQVILAAGSTVTLSSTGTSSLSVVTTGGGSVTDSGTLSAENADGTPGTIILKAGMASGTTTLTSTAVLDASAPNGGNGGDITVDAYRLVLDETAPLDVSAPQGTPGTVTIDPTVTDVGTPQALEAIDSSQASYMNNSSVCISLTANISLGGSYNWTPLGNSTTPFTGIFNGNGYVVSGYTIGTSSSSYGGNNVGFIGVLGTGGVVKNLGVAGTVYVNGNIVGGVVGGNSGTVEYSYNTGKVTGTGSNVGGVVGCNSGMVEYSYNTGAVSGNSYVGGVVGVNNTNSTVEYSYNTGAVSGNSYVGGVVGCNSGMVEYSYNTGAVSGNSYVGGVVGVNSGQGVQYSYATGSVTGTGSDIGGLAGYSNSKISNSYATGSVTGTGTGTGASISTGIGGLVGCEHGSTISYSYATGKVTVTGTDMDIGGLVGYDSNGSYTADYWNSTPNTTLTACGVITSGSSYAGMYSLSASGFGSTGNFSGWTSTNSAGFNTWSSGKFTSSVATDPWFEGKVGSGTGTMTAPMLVPDLPTATVTGNSGTSVYNGSTVMAGYATTYTMGGSAIPSGVSVTAPAAFGPNVGSYSALPAVSGTITSAPPTQTSVYSVTAASGSWTITQVSLSFTGSVTNPTKTYDGTTTAILTTSNSTAVLSGFLTGQSATYTGAAGVYASANAGTGINVSATLGTGNFTSSGTGFLWSNYTVPTMTLSGTGTIGKVTLTATATSASMAYGGTVPTPSGTVTGFVNGQTLASDGGTVSWRNSGASTSNAGQYGIAGNVTLGSPYSGDYTIVQAGGNATALEIFPTHTIPPLGSLFGQTVALPFSGSTSLVGSSSPESLSSSDSDSDSEKVHPGSVVESTHTSSLSVSGGALIDVENAEP